MKKTILCALSAVALSSCADLPTEAVPADQNATPVEGERLAATQAAADTKMGSCEVEMDRDLTNTIGGNLNVTVPGRTASHGHHFRVYFTNATPFASRQGTNNTGVGVLAAGCKNIDGRIGFNTNACYVIAGTSWDRYGNYSGWPWTYDPNTNESSLTVPLVRANTDRLTDVTFWTNAGGFCYFQGRVTT